MRPSSICALCCALLCVSPFALVEAQTVLFSDDFERPDGPLDGWTIAAGAEVNGILGGLMSIGPTTAEHWVWAGDPAVSVPAAAENVTFEVDMEFLGLGSNAVVGRHAGFVFCATQPTQRANPNAFSGYFVDWIDRGAPDAPDDRGVRLTRVDAAVQVPLGPGQGAAAAPLDPPLTWRVEVDATSIRVYGDDELFWDIADSTYRGGYFGVWTWSNGQDVVFDDFSVTGDIKDVNACFGFTPSNPLAGSDIFFDAGCSIATRPIVSYSWDMGDGTTFPGETVPTVEHTYAFGDNYTVTLTVEDDGGNTDQFEQVVPVGDILVPFADDFSRPDGPLDGWTIHAGDWNIVGESLVAGPSLGGGQAGEQQAFADDPPGRLPETYTISWDWEFLAPVDSQPVGRHAGCFFEFNQPGIRWDGATSGYQLWWIDRNSDRGLTLARWNHADDGGGFTTLNPPGGTFDLFPNPPLKMRVEVDGPSIRVFGDDVLAIEVEDDTYRGGIFGLWTWDGAGQNVVFDNVVVDDEAPPCEEPTACFQADAGFAFAGDSIGFDGTCSVPCEGETIDAYEWDFGDGNTATGPTTSHAYEFADVYTVTLTVRSGGKFNTSEREVTVVGKVASYSDDFERPDGVPDPWLVATGDWSILGGSLVTAPTTAEAWIWAATNPAVAGPRNFTATFEMSFLNPDGAPGPGRHGGFQFLGSTPTTRTPGWNGYFVDWIDRDSDRGPRLTRTDNGGFTDLANSGLGNLLEVPPLDPPLEWEVQVEGDTIRVFGDGVQYIEVEDGTYTSGFFGFWAYSGAVELVIDNFELTGQALTACYTVDPAIPAAGQEVTFDASCSEIFGGDGTITSYEWDFGDGSTASGVSATHTFDFPDTYTVSLTVEDDGGGTASLSRVLTVGVALDSLAECFEGPLGPPADWTIVSGDWTVTDEEDLEVDTNITGGEAFIYAGSPPAILPPEFVAEVDWEYLNNPNPDIGRHAAVHFYWNIPTGNRFAADSNGYGLFYIDRANDRGLTLARWDGAVLTVLNPGGVGGTPDITEPPATVRIEVEGAFIRVYADDVLAIEAEDDTYRSGLFGLWAWSATQVRFDEVQVGVGTLPECGEPQGIGPFQRSDCNDDGQRNITDGVFLLNFLFTGGTRPTCLAACDMDGDGQVPGTPTDALFFFNFQFLGGTRLPDPLDNCGLSQRPEDVQVGCGLFTSCP